MLSLAAGVGIGIALATYSLNDPSLKKPTDGKRKERGTIVPSKEKGPEEEWIASSILATMSPAAKLGITSGELRDDSLSLTMPLKGNTNIHGTAFAGSLYSVAALCAWYAVVTCLRKEKVENQYTVVLKSAEVSYLRPFVDPLIVAKSMLPTTDDFESFLERLESHGKTTLNVTGSILLDDGREAATYTAVMCAFKPYRDKQVKKQ